MGKHILLIGVSTGEIAAEHANNSPAIANVTALKQALLSEVEGLRDDHVITLLNPDLRHLHHAIALMTYRCRHGDLCLIYYTGCGAIDAPSGKFYLTAQDTQQDAIATTAVSSDFIHEALPSLQPGLKRVMILDCMWGAVSPQRSVPGAESPLSTTLANCDCALFTALGSNANPWPLGDKGLSLYTQHLVAGITTGLADVDADGSVSTADLQSYMAQTLAASAAELFPLVICSPDGSPADASPTPWLPIKPYAPEREYRRSVEEYARHGHISPSDRNILEFLRHQLGITLHQSQLIESEVMAPHTKRQDHCDRYRQAYRAALELETPLGTPLKKWLRHLQQELALSHADIAAIETQLYDPQLQPYSPLQSLPPWLTPVDDPPKLPAHQQNGHGR